jgi:hypothetical protein
MGEYNQQDLANIGWAYAIAFVAVPSHFDLDFINACLEYPTMPPRQAL